MVKELEENLDFGIQKLIKSEPGLVSNDDEKHLVDGNADKLLAKSWARCSNETKIVLTQELEKMRK